MTHDPQAPHPSLAAGPSDLPPHVPSDAPAGGGAAPRIVVVGADGRPADAPSAEPAAAGLEPGLLVDQPTKVMRIGTMVKQLLEEVRSAPLDEAARTRLAEIHARSVRELEDGLSPELVEELRRITLPLDDSAPPSDAELRVAHAQLVGWLEGLFHGIQTAMVAQRMASQAQLAQLRHALPPGPGGGAPAGPGASGVAEPDGRQAPGQYL
ncbi:bacterial proteasome activator family protein [Cellulomonas aerilata]|uniref:Bacterial proteasome activator n=1 Tax=Cellulomonas aerilata TaxID=515326 RepID=A0A512D787_9CELL|nr:bacterial proteasome activator family protein [Cellulomonas aerilata]GEO32341.1 bacterial proteasome activator [Cellulomonas aerilata]